MMKRGGGNYRNPCLTMHQPWASLLVYGIKRIEGRSWPSPIRGRLWIHAASKVPEQATIKAMEDFYRELYSLHGITDVKFPEHYPVSRLLGCVEVVGCVKREELLKWEAIPMGARLEGQTDFCWLCENPQKLIVPFEMRGYQGVYNLERKIYDSAVRGLVPVTGPMPVQFPLPDPRDPFCLKPGCISSLFPEIKSAEVEESSSLSVAIAGARAAATQFNKKEKDIVTVDDQTNSARARSLKSKEESLKGDSMLENSLQESSSEQSSVHKNLRPRNPIDYNERSKISRTGGDPKHLPGASLKIFAAAVRGLKES